MRRSEGTTAGSDYIESVDSVSWSIDGNRQCFGGGKEGDIIDTKIVVDGGWLVFLNFGV